MIGDVILLDTCVKDGEYVAKLRQWSRGCRNDAPPKVSWEFGTNHGYQRLDPMGVAHYQAAHPLISGDELVNANLDRLGAHQRGWSWPASSDGLSVIVLLPPGYTLHEPNPLPEAAKEFAGHTRIAVFWKLASGPNGQCHLTWTFDRLNGRVHRRRITKEVEKINLKAHGAVRARPDWAKVGALLTAGSIVVAVIIGVFQLPVVQQKLHLLASNDGIPVRTTSPDLATVYKQAPSSGVAGTGATTESLVRSSGTRHSNASVASAGAAAAVNRAAGTALPNPPPGSAHFTLIASPGQFRDPKDIVVDNRGNMYVTDGVNNHVQKLPPTGTSRWLPWGRKGSGNGQFNLPFGIAQDREGDVYVVDSGNARIQKFSPAGSYITKWGTPGSAHGEFMSPSYIAVDGAGNVYVSDTGNGRIQEFTRTGQWLSQWQLSADDARLHEFRPQGIAVDTQGIVYAADSLNDCIQIWAPSGTSKGCWGSTGSGPGQFSSPCGMSLDSRGYLYLADSGNNRVQELLPDTQRMIDQWRTVGGSPSGVALDPEGSIYVTEGGDGRVERIPVR